jgi:hypothetical protein
MEIEDMRLAVQDGVAAALAEIEKQPKKMMSIEPFDAIDGDERPVRVVGVIAEGDALDFVCIMESATDAGEIYPTIESSVWRLPSPVNQPCRS